MEKKPEHDDPLHVPAHPQLRREPLPWHRPKPVEEDPDAPNRIKAILGSPATARPTAMWTFSSWTRPAGAAADRLCQARTAARAARGTAHHRGVRQHPHSRVRGSESACRGDAELERRLAVAERILAKSHYYDTPRELGRLVGVSGGGPHDSRVMVMTGGGPGMMEAANRGAVDVGAKSIGLNISLPHEQYPNPYITPDLCFSFHYFALRKLHFLLRARALVAFPVGYGTFDELFETLTLIQTRTIRPVPVVLAGERYWRKAFDVDFMVEEGVIDAEDRELFWHAETAPDIWDGIQQWHETNGTPLFPGNR